MANPVRVVTADRMPDGCPEVAVAVVGGGACGQVCAIRLRQLGVAVVVLERDAQPTGSTALSSGFIPAATTQVQRAQGIEDTLAQFEQDIQAKAFAAARQAFEGGFNRPGEREASTCLQRAFTEFEDLWPELPEWAERVYGPMLQALTTADGAGLAADTDQGVDA